MALYENALNQTGYDTHLSYARCSPRYLGVGLCGKYISCKPMEETENVPNVSLARLPQGDVVYLCCMPLCENNLNQTGSNSHLSYDRCSLRHLGVGLSGQNIWWKSMEETENSANLSRAHVPQRHLVYLCCMASSGNTLKETGNITHLSCARFPLGCLCAGLCGQSTYGKPIEQTVSFSNVERHLVYLCCMPSSGSTLKQTGDITHLSCARFPLGCLCAGSYGKSTFLLGFSCIIMRYFPRILLLEVMQAMKYRMIITKIQA